MAGGGQAGNRRGDGEDSRDGRRADGTAEPVAQVETFIGKRETARRLGCGVRTLESWMRRGLVPYYKISKKVAFKWSDLEAALKANSHRNRCGHEV